MASLTGQLVAETYKALLKLIDNDILTASEKQITDGFGGGSNVFIDSQGFLRANKYKVTNGLATQFLKADGSLDSNAYLTSITGAQVITALGYTPVPTTRTITINGETHNLAADNSWTVGGTAAIWGNITGTLSNQTDLQNALNAKFDDPTGTISQYIRGDGSIANFPALTGYVPYSGATSNVNLGEYGLTAGFLGFDTTPTGTPTGIGTMYWDAPNRTISLIDGDGDTTLQIGQEERVLVHNNTGATLTDGQVVYVTGSTGELPSVALASNTAEATSSVTLGVVTESIAHGADGFITTSGIVHGLNTLAFTEGAAIYLGSTPGTFTQTKPVAPNNLVLIGYIIKKAGGNGSIFVKIQNGYELEELHDVYIADPANNHGLFYDIADGLWKNKSIAGALGYTPQAQLSGTGFVKASGTTITYDNSTYLTTTDAASTYQRLDKMVSNLLASDTEYPNSNAVIAALALKANAANPVFTGNMTISGAEPKLYFTDTDQNPDYFIGVDAGFFRVYDQTAGATRFLINSDGNISTGTGKSITAGSFIKDGGTATQFLKADGSVDATDYATVASLANYLLSTTAASTYQRLDKMVSNLLPSSTEYPNSNAVINALALKADAANPVFTGNMTISGATPRLYFVDTDQNPDYTIFIDSGFFYIYDQTAGATRFQINSSGNISTGVGKSITAGSFVKDGGTASQYLMADGSVSTGPNLSGYVTGSGTATRVAFFDGTNSITSSSGLFWDNTAGRLAVGKNSADARLEVYAGTKGQIRANGGTAMGGGLDIYTELSGTGRRNWGIYTEVQTPGDMSFLVSASAGTAPIYEVLTMQATGIGLYKYDFNVVGKLGTADDKGIFYRSTSDVTWKTYYSTSAPQGLITEVNADYLIRYYNAGTPVTRFTFSLDGNFTNVGNTTTGGTIQSGGNVGIKTAPSATFALITANQGITGSNTYFGSGQVRVGGPSDHGANTVFSVAPGVVEFDRPGVGGGALKIFSDGNIGINQTTNSGYKVDISGDLRAIGQIVGYNANSAVSNNPGNSQIRASASSTKWLSVGYDPTVNVGYLQGAESGISWRPIVLNLNGTTTSPVLIGQSTSDGVNKLQVTGSGWFSNNVSASSLSAGTLSINTNTSTERINVNGAVGFQNTSSVQKFHIQYFNGGLTFTESGIADYRIFIKDGGNVGIGTANPASGRKLTVAGGAQFTYTDNGGASFNIVPGVNGQDGADFNLSYYTGTGYGPLTFTLSGSIKMTLAANGNLGINRSPYSYARLNVFESGSLITNGNAIAGTNMKGVFVENTNNGDESVGLWFRTGDNHLSGISGQRDDNTAGWGTDLRFYTHERNTTDLTYTRERMRITTEGYLLIGTRSISGYRLEVNGSVLATSYFESSDSRLKNIHKKYDSNEFGAIEFGWIDGRDSKNHWGYIAQEVQKWIPDAVNLGKDGFLSVDYNQAHTFKIAKVEDEVTKLKKRVAELEKQLNVA